ncbi:hypothetical protein BGZ70_009467 [Mortierella alpina]|uniref:Uncharacterized protein n=1 Tax=Mortierella alpina TaxID=64518 RepID=A0A9P6LZR2_MORAP|nr:hypothetical protein BGZ70_009467 [Mortierella alpina]
MDTVASNAAQARAQAHALSLQYPPWCLLHMLLKHHKALFSTLLLEELLPPHNHSQSSVTSLSHTQSPAHQHRAHLQDQESPPAPAARPRARAVLSRHLVQRLHFGYYGNKHTLSESAVRYLTARARLEYGYFVIRGRAFWNINHEDLLVPAAHLKDPSAVAAAAVPAGKDKKAAASVAGVNTVIAGHQQVPLRQGSPWPIPVRDQTLHQHHQQQSQAPGSMEDNDAGGIKEDDPYRIAYAASPALVGGGFGSAGVDGRMGVEDEAEQRQRIAMANQRCEEREERRLLLVAVRYCERCQPDMAVVFDSTAATYSSITPVTVSSERQAAAEYWRRVAYTSTIASEVHMDTDDLVSIPPSPFLGRRVDTSWMKRLQQSPVSSMQYSSHRDLSYLLTRMRMVQDDARLFQIASGIFDGLATYPRKIKKPIPSIIDGPLSLSLSTLRTLVFEYGYMPLPEDDQDRKAHYKGGVRAHSGEDFEFPSDGSHVVNKRGLKGQGTSIWYFYDLQRTETMVVYLMHKAPEVLDWLFERGFELQIQHPSGRSGVSAALLLQCCIPGLHAMVRHVHKPISTTSHEVPLTVDVATIQRELLGYGRKSQRIEFRREDFVEVLKGIPPAQLGPILRAMSDLGMDNTVVQDRLVELLQVPGGTSPMMVEKAHLHALASKTSLAPSNEESLFAMDDIAAIATEPANSISYINSINGYDSDSDCDYSDLEFYFKVKPPKLAAARSIVNRAIQEAFEVHMDVSGAQDPEWKIVFEDTLSNLKLESLIVHPEVSDWVCETMSGPEPAFQTCFDHALMEALHELLNWNNQQVWRLERWCQTMENESRSRSIMGGRHPWEEVKSKVLGRRQPEEHEHSSSRNATQDEDQDELMQEASEGLLDGRNELIGLDIEWTTNDQIILNTASTVADMPGGSEIVRVSGNGCLLLDNGCLDQELLLCGQQTEDDVYSLETNVKVYDFLRKGAVVEEKHLIWLALGLVTATYKGRDVAHIVSRRQRHRHHQHHRGHHSNPPNHHYPRHHHHHHHHHHQKRQQQQQQQRQRQRQSLRQNSAGPAVIPVKMACSPEAYQLVWMLASTFIRQALNRENEQLQQALDFKYGLGFSGLQTAEASTLSSDSGPRTGMSGLRHDGSWLPRPKAPFMTMDSNAHSPPLSPVPLSSTMIKVQEMQTLLTSCLGADAWLMNEILTEIEDDLEERAPVLQGIWR